MPCIVENILHTSIFIIDALMISRLGAKYLAAAVLAGSIIWRISFTLACIQAGTVAMVARFYGARDYRRVNETIGQGLLLGTIVGSIALLIGTIGARPFLQWMGGAEDVIEVGTPYMRIIFLASIFRFILFIGTASLRGAGDTRTPMFITLLMNIVNVVLNWVLIFGIWIFPRLELTGAAIASVISITIGAFLVLYVLLTGKSLVKVSMEAVRRFNIGITRQILRISLPNGAEQVLMSIGFLIFVRMVAELGTATLAAHGITIRIESISWMIGIGFAVATTTLVGQSLGQEEVGLAKRSFRNGMLLATGTMTFLGIIFLTLTRPLISLFAPEPEVMEIAVICLRITAFEQPLIAIAMTYAGGMRGAGDTLSPMITGIVGNIFIRVMVGYVLAFTFGLGIVGIYLATVIDWACRSVVILWFYRKGKWERVVIT